MAENTITPELLERINQFAGAGAVSDQEMQPMMPSLMQDNDQIIAQLREAMQSPENTIEQREELRRRLEMYDPPTPQKEDNMEIIQQLSEAISIETDPEKRQALVRMLELYMPTMGSGATSDQERQMFEAAQPMQMPMPSAPTAGSRVRVMGSGAVSDQEMDIFEGAQTGAQNAGFMQGLQELEQQKQMSNDPDEIEALDAAITRLVTGANAPLGDLARQVQAAGTGEDTQLAHLSPGEIVLPAEFMQDEELEGMIERKFRESNIDPAQAVAGVGIASLNQMTGLEEFGFFKKIGKKLKKIVRPLAKVAQFIPGPWQPIAAIADKALTVVDVVKGDASPLNLLSVAGPLRVGPGIKDSIGAIKGASSTGGFFSGLGQSFKDIPGALRSGIGSLASDPIGSVKGLFQSANPADYVKDSKGNWVNKVTGEGLPFGAKVPSDLLSRSGGGIQSLTGGFQGRLFGTEGMLGGIEQGTGATYQDAAGNVYTEQQMLDAGLIDPTTKAVLPQAAGSFATTGAGPQGAGGAGTGPAGAGGVAGAGAGGVGAGAAQPQGSAFGRFLSGLLPGGGGGLAGGLGSLAGLGLAGGAAYGLGKLAMEEARRDKGVPMTPLTTMDAGGRYNIEAEIARRMGKEAPNPVEFGLQPRFPTLSGGQAGPRKEAVTSQYVQGASMGGAMQPMYAMAYANGGDVAMEDFEKMNGYIDGPGTETSDDIPAMLSDGEFVMTGQAVRGAGSFDLNEEPNGILTLVPSASESRERGTQLMYQMMDVFGRYANATN